MWRQGSHFVEDGAQVLLDFIAHIYLLLEKVNIVHPRIFGKIYDSRIHRIDLIKVGDHHLMDLLSELLLRQTANRMRHVLSEGLVDLIFVEVYRSLRVLQVLDIVEHIKRVFQRHEEVIHLIKAMSISDNLLEE